MIQWQIRLRTVFVIRIALFKYRLHVSGFELPANIQAAEREFDSRLATILERMAERLEGNSRKSEDNCESFIELLEEAVQISSSGKPPDPCATVHPFLSYAW